MTTTTGTRDQRDLDTAHVLAEVAVSRATADREEARILALAVHLVDLHPVTEGASVATWDAAFRSLDDSRPIESLAGSGTPAVAEFVVEELGAVLGVSYRAAHSLAVDAVELCFRLPRLWALVHAGRLQAWKARQVAAHSTDLSAAVVAFVDQHVSVTAVHNRIPANLKMLVHEALLRCDPDTALGVEEAALLARDVSFRFTESTATAQMFATLDTLDAIDLDNTIADLATRMRELGDTSPLGIRRAHALGSLAHPQSSLDLASADGDGAGSADPSIRTARQPHPSPMPATLFLHIDADDLQGAAEGGTGTGGLAERLGPGTLDLLREWLRRVGHVTIRPVLDLSRADTVDVHDPPGWMRETVILRDGQCIFPGCSVDARSCDLDHITPYLPPEDGGPPGQTSVDALAALCRRHHRLKTFTTWTYHRTGARTYGWTDPYATSYATQSIPKTAPRHP